MKNTLKINHANHTIVMDRTFAKFAANTFTDEYAHLQQVRRDYPNYQVVRRHIRTNNDKKTYKGLTYSYMEDYILTHGSQEERIANFNDYTEMRIIAECHGKAFRYPLRTFSGTIPHTYTPIHYHSTVQKDNPPPQHY